MTADHIITLPGDLPGLLRPCSPVYHLAGGWGGIVYDASPQPDGAVLVGGSSWGMGQGSGHRFQRAEFGLLLAARGTPDPTGCAHAAWWAWSRRNPEHEDAGLWGDLLRGSAAGRCGNVDRLRRGCLSISAADYRP